MSRPSIAAYAAWQTADWHGTNVVFFTRTQT